MQIPSLFQQRFWVIYLHTLISMAGMLFGIDAAMGGVPMSPEVYGAYVYMIHAEAWAGMCFASSFLIVMGVSRPSCLGAVLCTVGSTLGMLLYATFFVMSQSAPHGDILKYFGGIVLTAFYSVTLAQSIQFLWGYHVRK